MTHPHYANSVIIYSFQCHSKSVFFFCSGTPMKNFKSPCWSINRARVAYVQISHKSRPLSRIVYSILSITMPRGQRIKFCPPLRRVTSDFWSASICQGQTVKYRAHVVSGSISRRASMRDQSAGWSESWQGNTKLDLKDKDHSCPSNPATSAALTGGRGAHLRAADPTDDERAL